jgi:hypothetical protein
MCAAHTEFIKSDERWNILSGNIIASSRAHLATDMVAAASDINLWKNGRLLKMHW